MRRSPAAMRSGGFGAGGGRNVHLAWTGRPAPASGSRPLCGAARAIAGQTAGESRFRGLTPSSQAIARCGMPSGQPMARTRRNAGGGLRTTRRRSGPWRAPPRRASRRRSPRGTSLPRSRSADRRHQCRARQQGGPQSSRTARSISPLSAHPWSARPIRPMRQLRSTLVAGCTLASESIPVTRVRSYPHSKETGPWRPRDRGDLASQLAFKAGRGGPEVGGVHRHPQPRVAVEQGSVGRADQPRSDLARGAQRGERGYRDDLDPDLSSGPQAASPRSRFEMSNSPDRRSIRPRRAPARQGRSPPQGIGPQRYATTESSKPSRHGRHFGTRRAGNDTRSRGRRTRTVVPGHDTVHHYAHAIRTLADGRALRIGVPGRVDQRAVAPPVGRFLLRQA